MRLNFIFTYVMLIMMVLVIAVNITTVSADPTSDTYISQLQNYMQDSFPQQFGDAGYTIDQSGCMITAVADVVSAYIGPTDPPTLNHLLLDAQNEPTIQSSDNNEEISSPTPPNTDESLLDRCDEFIPDHEGREHFKTDNHKSDSDHWWVYDDASKEQDPTKFKGKHTVGVGFNMDDPSSREIFRDAFKEFNEVIPDFDAVRDGKLSLTEDQVDTLYTKCLHINLDAAKRQVSNFDQLDTNAKMVVMDLIFNMGESAFSKCQKMRAALNDKDYTEAAHQMDDIRMSNSRKNEDQNLLRSSPSGKQ